MIEITTTQKEFEQNIAQRLANTYNAPSGVNSMIKMTYKDCSAKEHWLEVTHVVNQGEVNPHGNLHGGISAWLLDTAMGMLNVTLAKTGISPTINMQINYESGARAGDEIVIRSHIDRIGGTIIFSSAEIRCEGRLIASAQGTYMNVK